jgi:hypothetical protein
VERMAFRTQVLVERMAFRTQVLVERMAFRTQVHAVSKGSQSSGEKATQVLFRQSPGPVETLAHAENKGNEDYRACLGRMALMDEMAFRL